MQHHLRCPACGQVRPEKAFWGAGAHRLEAVQLRGKGQGKGFDRFVAPMTAAVLDFVAVQLDRARAQVEELRAHAHALPPPVPTCPHCGWPAVSTAAGWSCSRCSLSLE